MPIRGLALASMIGATSAGGVTQYKEERKPFHFDVSSFTSSLDLPVEEKVEIIRMSEDTMRQRLTRSKTDVAVEPLTLTLPPDNTQIVGIAEKIALSGRVDQLVTLLRNAAKVAKPVKEGSKVKSIELNEDAFSLVDPAAFAELYAKNHHKLVVDGSFIKKSPDLRRRIMRELAPFLKKNERKVLSKRIRQGRSISVDQHLLPDFARKMVGKFIPYRGPNCFHAALAFQSPRLTSSSMINVKEEVGYHRAMINYDELWRIIARGFYEIDPAKAPLKYGDMLVFFDVPENVGKGVDVPIDYRWIRHASTYLFSGYTFSKGSKSPNTPYVVRTLADEWDTWKRYTKNLGIKVYRRSHKSVKAQPPRDLSDWIY